MKWADVKQAGMTRWKALSPPMRWAVAGVVATTMMLLAMAYYGRHDDELTLEKHGQVWPTLPVQVACGGMNSELCKATEEEVQSLNEQLGFKMLEFTTGMSSITIWAYSPPTSLGGCTAPEGGCYARYGNRTTNLSCEVYVHNVATHDLERDIVTHELGHCMGLTDDDYSSSLMYSLQHPVTGRGSPSLSRRDREALRRAYGIHNP